MCRSKWQKPWLRTFSRNDWNLGTPLCLIIQNPAGRSKSRPATCQAELKSPRYAKSHRQNIIVDTELNYVFFLVGSSNFSQISCIQNRSRYKSFESFDLRSCCIFFWTIYLQVNIHKYFYSFAELCALKNIYVWCTPPLATYKELCTSERTYSRVPVITDAITTWRPSTLKRQERPNNNNCTNHKYQEYNNKKVTCMQQQ